MAWADLSYAALVAHLPEGWWAASEWGRLYLHGPGATDYLHSQTSQRVRDVPIGGSTTTAVISATAHLVDWVTLLRVEEEGWWLVTSPEARATLVPWLQRGLLPYLAALASVPIPAFAPVMITALGIDWPSKAAVVAVVVLFPFVISVVKGLNEIPPELVDLLHSYHATPWQRLRWVRWPHALPYVFNALKITVTLAAIAAIAAEFMGSPSYGLGFRIRSEAGRFQFDRVWAAIVYATAGSTILFNLVVSLEKRLLFWQRR